MGEIIMSEFKIIHRHALQSKETISAAGISLAALPEGSVLHALAKHGDVDAERKLKQLADDGDFDLRPLSPGQWFIVRDRELEPGKLKLLTEALSTDIDLIDQSHGRVRILISGHNVERVLAKGTAVDLSLNTFPVGHATATLIGHIGVHLTRKSEDVFEIIVLRGFAESLWDDLVLMSFE